jgi:serine/threonine protein kinase
VYSCRSVSPETNDRPSTETVNPFVSTSVPASEERLQLPATRTDMAPRSLLSQLQAGSGPNDVSKRYAVRESVGSGGMGDVRRVHDADLNREVAMKVLKPGKGLSRFVAEAQIASQLEHPNLVPVHDLGVDSDGNLFFTMQYVRSRETVGNVIAKLRSGDREYFKRYTFERRVHIIQQVCHALHYAHERGVVHRDIKPANVMLGSHGEVYLLDWGVAKLIDSEEGFEEGTGPMAPKIEAEALIETTDGSVVGTPAYMAPEQLLGEIQKIDGRTDLYALCAVAYELLSLHYHMGRGDGKGRVTVYSLINTPPEDAENHYDPLNGRVPRPLSRICRKGLSKDREERFQSAKDLEDSLQLWHEGKAPVVCLGTFMQRGLGIFSGWIDKHPLLVPFTTVGVVALLLFWLSTLTTFMLSR